eukprot:CAMPEP_0198309142 /NCGR_PEP_ID=MMETSP1450-20131203/1607_1 /TAXON_ID=753684 ORGANISM="Madagascaria erythrocladiodes, Strain CCMP3234" /NCGR_SAMPLE_ID=MMETSP1450 /ASSEMBLY_ACC=CAM_ASM_001115 /LENGTH=70 /DNA_ID=CAMNT_0044011885 /DNA_START=22 /DNA_END=230 /DNA_ORIENTATION=+
MAAPRYNVAVVRDVPTEALGSLCDRIEQVIEGAYEVKVKVLPSAAETGVIDIEFRTDADCAHAINDGTFV